jgi:hypothetical protein
MSTSPTRSALLTTFNAGMASLVTAGACSALDLNPAVPAALAAAGVAGTVVRERRRARHVGMPGLSAALTAWRCAPWLAAGAWASWSTYTGPFHTANLVAAGAAGLLGALVAPAFAEDDPAPVAARRDPEPLFVSPLVREWKARIERLCRVWITIGDVINWPNGAGFTLNIDFADGSGDTWEAIRDRTRALAASARLPKGCVIDVTEGDVQGTAVVRVPIKNNLAEIIYAPNDFSPLTVTGLLPIGAFGDTLPTEIEVRQSAGLVMGRRRSGKTNLLHAIIGALVRCPDALIWIVDLNGGGLAVPWLMPSVEGLVEEYPIDWVAWNPETAIKMAQVAPIIARDRKARYARLKAKANTDLLPVSADLPEIVIIVDEGAEVMGDSSRARPAIEAFLELQRIGGAEAVNVIFSGLRATQDTLPVGVRKQAALRISTKVADDGELGYLFGDTRVRCADLQYPGCAFIQRDDSMADGTAPVRQFKAHRWLPQHIEACVLATIDRRPNLDAAGVAVGGKIYANRWADAEPLLARLRGEAGPSTPARPEPAPVPPAPAAPPGTLEDRDEARNRARHGLRQLVMDMALAELPDDHVEAEFAQLTAGGIEALPVTAEHEPVDQDQDDDADEVTTTETARGRWSPERLIELARAAKDQGGITPSEMKAALDAEGIEVSNKTLFKWLERFVEQDRLDNNKGRYTALD